MKTYEQNSKHLAELAAQAEQKHGFKSVQHLAALADYHANKENAPFAGVTVELPKETLEHKTRPTKRNNHLFVTEPPKPRAKRKSTVQPGGGYKNLMKDGLKFCPSCQKTKIASVDGPSDFSRWSLRPDGLDISCRACVKEKRDELKARHKAKVSFVLSKSETATTTA